MFKIVLAGACLLVAGCASGPVRDAVYDADVTLVPEPAFAISYSGEIGDPKPPQLIAAGGEFQPAPDDRVVTVEVRILRVADGAARALGIQGSGAHSLDEAEAQELVAELRARRDGSLITAPRLSVYERQTGTISIMNEVSYVSGFDITDDGPARIVDPVIEIVQDGLALEVKAVRAGEALSLTLSLAMAEVLKPIGTQSVEVYGQRIHVQTPQVLRQKLDCSGEVKPGRVLALSGLTTRDGEALLVLVKAATSGE